MMEFPKLQWLFRTHGSLRQRKFSETILLDSGSVERYFEKVWFPVQTCCTHSSFRQNSNVEPLLNDVSDKNLVDASRSGDRDAYARLANRYYERVFVICLGILGSVHDAEDITQDALLKGLLSIGTLKDSSQFGFWIVRIAKNYCLSRMRREKHGREILAQKWMPPDQTPESYETLQRAIAKLPLESRLPLVAYYFGSESVKDVAERLGLSHSAVYQRLRRATRQLHTLLTKQGDVR